MDRPERTPLIEAVNPGLPLRLSTLRALGSGNELSVDRVADRAYRVHHYWTTEWTSTIQMNGARRVDGATHGVLQRLARVSLIASDTLEMLSTQESLRLKWLVPHVQRIYDTVNDVMDTIDQQSSDRISDSDD